MTELRALFSCIYGRDLHRTEPNTAPRPPLGSVQQAVCEDGAVARLAEILANTEDPVALFERLTGRKIDK